MLITLDYDGTLAHEGMMAQSTIDALYKAKESDLLLALITGRPCYDLYDVCPCADVFDFILAENGAVLLSKDQWIRLADPPPEELFTFLEQEDIFYTRGQVVVGIHRQYAAVVQDIIVNQDWPLHVVLNKDAAMILPLGVDKGAGLSKAVKLLNIDNHRIVAIGDAENDLPLFKMAHTRVAPIDAIDTIKSKADIVLKNGNGLGVEDFIQQLITP